MLFLGEFRASKTGRRLRTSLRDFIFVLRIPQEDRENVAGKKRILPGILCIACCHIIR